MCEIVKKEREISGVKFETYKKEIIGSNSIEVEVGTTGYMGGDSGHGGRTFFSIRDLACTDIEVSINGAGFDVELGGDSELSTLIEALEFSLKILKNQTNQT